MRSVKSPDKNGVYIELDAELLSIAQAFAKDRGEGFAFMVAEALRRHMAYPTPARPVPRQIPLSDAETSKPKTDRKAKK
ncbi:MAG TPA: hypothetical protein VG122_25940 [Gemmata sp.]|jgi:hypothetical protein|nr:hypothetical protein [Gemmata sp.]